MSKQCARETTQLNFKAEIVTSKKNKYTLLFPQQDSPIGKEYTSFPFCNYWAGGFFCCIGFHNVSCKLYQGLLYSVGTAKVYGTV